MKKITKRFSFIMVLTLVFTLVLSGCKKEVVQEQADPTPTPAKEVTETADGGVADLEGESEEVAETVEYAMQMGTVEVLKEVIYLEDFEDGQTDIKGRGAAKVTIVSDKFYEGANSLFVSGRTALWNGATIDLTKSLAVAEAYHMEAYVMYEDGADTLQIDCKMEKNTSEYLNFASTKAVKGEWTPISGNIIIPDGTTTASVYFETGMGGAGFELTDFYVDGIVITKEIVTADRGELPALKDAYKDLFSIGVAATANEITDSRRALVKEQFNSLTPGNELKPDSVLDYATCISDPKYDENPAVKFDRVESILKFAQESGIPMRGHTLVWHSQTPRWFFAEGYSNAANAPLVSKELMLKRMENYIKQVLEYTQTNYPGLIYAWDVVNEAINTGDGEDGGLRSKDSLWYQVIGPEFVEKAFEYARKYAVADAKLFYNDYNTEDPGKMLSIFDLVKGLKEKGLLDGIGLQCHFTVDSPSLIDVETSIRKYAELGIEIQITELDMGLEENTEEAYIHQAKRYKRIFTVFKHLDETGAANITNVTFWGLSDDISWLSQPGVPSYPLLFDKYLMQKPAFWGVILSPDIPLY
ncbi:MAG: endo-1,4-beta-xylanase [Mobilitalea sp.]